MSGPELFTDLAGLVNLGFGFLFKECWSFQHWPLVFFRAKKPSIVLLELLVIVIVVDTLAVRMSGRQIRICSDNEAMVEAINKASSKCPHCLTFLSTVKEHQLVLTIAIYQMFLIPIVNNGELF